jgi:hypothetical protein
MHGSHGQTDTMATTAVCAAFWPCVVKIHMAVWWGCGVHSVSPTVRVCWLVCRFDFEGVDVKGLFDEYHETEKRMKELKEKGGIQRQVSATHIDSIICLSRCLCMSKLTYSTDQPGVLTSRIHVYTAAAVLPGGGAVCRC